MNSIFLKFAGSKKISMAPNMAMLVSDMFGITFSSKGLVIQSVATSMNTIETIFSGSFIFPMLFSCFWIRLFPPFISVLFIGNTNFVSIR